MNGDQLEDKLVKAKASIIILDIEMPGDNGIELVKKIRKVDSEVKIIMQTVYEDDDILFAAITAGANGYILKADLFDKLIPALREVSLGGAPMSPLIAAKVFKLFQVLSQDRSLEPVAQTEYNLTNREHEILELLVEGKSYKLIASDLFVSYETVHSHIKNIYKKLHVASMTEAVSKAIKDKII